MVKRLPNILNREYAGLHRAAETPGFLPVTNFCGFAEGA